MSAVPDPGTGAAEPPVVPGYVLEELLGRGGSGEVWRARPRAGGDPVAVKVLVAGDAERQAREAALLGELDHPHLVRLREVVHQPRRGEAPRVALVLDLLAGGSLAALLAARGRLRPGEVVTALAPVAAALAHAHGHGVVHGDLSPGNIVFTAEGRPVLTDLGVARVLGEQAAGEVTPAYVDPTVARGGAPGPASDVFGVAAAAFHALTGIPPWNAGGAAETVAVAAAGELPDLDELAPGAPPELRSVVARGLAADPAARGSAAAFALDLRHACRPEPVRLPAPGIPPEELARTGAARRTELTHQVPGRRAAPAGPPPDEDRRRRSRPAWWRHPATRPVAWALMAAGVAAAGWFGLHGAGRDASMAAARPAGVAAVAPTTSAAALSTAAPTVAPTPRSASPTSSARTPGPTAPVVAADRQEPPSSATGWQDVVTALYARRARAFTTGTAGPLDEVYVPASRLRSADAQHIDALISAGSVLRGFAPTVTTVTDVHAGADTVALHLIDSWPAYEVVSAADPRGAVTAAPGRAAGKVAMTLRRTPAGWRIESAELIG